MRTFYFKKGLYNYSIINGLKSESLSNKMEISATLKWR